VKTSSRPDGYAPHGAYAWPIKDGGMSSWQAEITLVGDGNLLQGGPMEGQGDITFSGAGDMALVISMSGNGSITISGIGGLALTIGMAGDGTISLSGFGGLSMIVPIDGTANFGLTGSGNLKGNLDLEGEWGGSTPLSPEGLANAVWGALAASNNSIGTMGALLNASGAAGDPWAVTLEGTYTAAELMRIMASVLAGKVSGAGSGTETFRGVADLVDRVVSVNDAQGNRTAITLDGA
jgi:hypothetical protein